MKHPVILIVDNDDGGKKVIKAGEKLAGTKFDRPGDLFFSVTENLYIIPTPLGSSGAPSAIKTLFLKACWIKKSKEKNLIRKRMMVMGTSYRKHIFAEKKVRPGVGIAGDL